MAHPTRPTSPHLQVYRWQITMVMSILHRATGVALSVGAVLLVCWLLALADGPESFAAIEDCLHSWFGLLCLFGWTFCLYYHLCNGLRHLAWDIGKGFSMEGLYKGGYIVAGTSAGLTLLTWLIILTSAG